MGRLYASPTDCERFLTAREAADIGTGDDRNERLASRWCLKEAVLKTIGGLQQGLSLTEVEIEHDPSGVPLVRVSGGVKATAEALGIRTWLVSTSHNDGFAVATAVALGRPPRRNEPASVA